MHATYNMDYKTHFSAEQAVYPLSWNSGISNIKAFPSIASWFPSSYFQQQVTGRNLISCTLEHQIYCRHGGYNTYPKTYYDVWTLKPFACISRKFCCFSLDPWWKIWSNLSRSWAGKLSEHLIGETDLVHVPTWSCQWAFKELRFMCESVLSIWK